MKRMKGLEVGRLVERQMPTTPPTATMPRGGRAGEGERTVQINFRASEGLDRLLKREAGDDGIRVFIARVLQQAGYAVPDYDLVPHHTRRAYE